MTSNECVVNHRYCFDGINAWQPGIPHSCAASRSGTGVAVEEMIRYRKALVETRLVTRYRGSRSAGVEVAPVRANKSALGTAPLTQLALREEPILVSLSGEN